MNYNHLYRSKKKKKKTNQPIKLQTRSLASLILYSQRRILRRQQSRTVYKNSAKKGCLLNFVKP